jgi:hypothetical protein
VIAVAVALGGAGCGDEVSHENIDRWRGTEKGPAKLVAALRGAKNEVDLRAHAAQNLIQIGRWEEVNTTFENVDPSSQRAIAAKLAGRLRADASVPEGYSPSRVHVAAKDSLFEIRGYADDPTRAAIDEYLAEWLAANYADRVARGRVPGGIIVRTIGARAAPRLLADARSLIAAAPNAEGAIPMLGDELLKALATTGDGEAVSLLVDLAGKAHAEPSLQRRAMAALYVAYVENTERPMLDPATLAPHVEALAKIARDESQPGGNVNDAVALIAAAGAPACVDPLVGLIKEPREEPAFLWLAVQKGLVCGGAAGFGAMVEAIPTLTSHPRGILEKYLWDKARALGPEGQVAESSRKLLGSSSWVSRITGVELLGMTGSKADAAAVRELANDRTVLKHWWDEVGRGVEQKAPRRPVPTIGQVALEVAKKLEMKR